MHTLWNESIYFRSENVETKGHRHLASFIFWTENLLITYPIFKQLQGKMLYTFRFLKCVLVDYLNFC